MFGKFLPSMLNAIPRATRVFKRFIVFAAYSSVNFRRKGKIFIIKFYKLIKSTA